MIVKALQRQERCSIYIRLFTPGPGILPIIATQECFDTLQLFATSLSQLQLVVHAGNNSCLFSLSQLLASATQLNSLSIYLAGRVENLKPYIKANLSPYLIKALQTSAISTLSKFSTLELVNVCICNNFGPNQWLQLVQWPFLRSVTFSCPGFIHQFSTQLAHIRKLSLQLDAHFSTSDTCCPRPHSTEDIQSSLLNFAKLESLEIRNATSVINEELYRQFGSILRTLKVNSDQDPSPTPSTPKVYLSPHDLISIASNCPWLRDLTIDMPGDEVRVLFPT